MDTNDFDVLEMKFLDNVLDVYVTVFMDRLSAMGCLFTGTGMEQQINLD